MLSHRVTLLALLCWSAATAQNLCRFYLVDHYDFNDNIGVALSLGSSNTGPNACSLDSVGLSLAVGDGTVFNYAGATPQWQPGQTYTAKAVLTANGPQQLYLDGHLAGTATGAFQPMPGALLADEIPAYASGQTDYSIEQTSLQATNGSQQITLPAAGAWVEPVAPLLLLGGTPIWAAWLDEDPTQTVTITTTFQFQPALPNPTQYDPYIDRYGQTNFGSWPGKIAADGDLPAAAASEQIWLRENPPFPGLDVYGGSTVAGWHDTATGYYHTAQHDGRWWLITPLGNPCFYISLSAVEPGIQATPVTGRMAEFAALPPDTGASAAAYSTNYWETSVDRNTVFVHFDTANRILKYGDQWQTVSANLAVQRAASWGFAGFGKWSAIATGVPVTPVLDHAAVPNVVPGGHPDA